MEVGRTEDREEKREGGIEGVKEGHTLPCSNDGEVKGIGVGKEVRAWAEEKSIHEVQGQEGLRGGGPDEGLQGGGREGGRGGGRGGELNIYIYIYVYIYEACHAPLSSFPPSFPPSLPPSFPPSLLPSYV